MKLFPNLLAFCLGSFLALAAEDKAPALPEKPADPAEALKTFLDALKPRHGEIDLRSGLARAVVPERFAYLGPEDARKVLVDLWGNPPPDENPLGLIYPASEGLVSDQSWAIIISYEEDGHVKDDDATSIKYDELLQQMQKGAQEANKERVKEGYAPVELVGWAAAPRYDATTHKLYWAKNLKFGDSPENTLNYNIRMLGRRGVLVLNAVAPVSRLKDIEAATPDILAMVDFQEGHRYADFDSKTDKVATYGLAALVAGGVAAKMGLFKGLIALLIAGKKLVVVAVIGAVAMLKRFFGGRRDPTRRDLPPSGT